jgi:hypothetical protein
MWLKSERFFLKKGLSYEDFRPKAPIHRRLVSEAIQVSRAAFAFVMLNNDGAIECLLGSEIGRKNKAAFEIEVSHVIA